MDHADFERAATYWERKDAAGAAASPESRMGADELRQEIDTFLAKHNTCALATAAGDAVRCTPLEYTYHDGAVWIFSEGGRKFVGLEANPQISLCVYEGYQGFGGLASVQMDGTAEILLPGDAEYASAAEFRHIPLETLEKLPEPMYLIKVTPQRVDYLRSDLKKRGLSSRQHLEVS